MTPNMKLTTAVLVVVTAVVAALLIASRPAPVQESAPGAEQGRVPPELLVRPDSHRLSVAPSGEVTVVEFLDLECEACRAAFPIVEQLRRDYGDRVTFVLRYFPLPGHRNSDVAARAVEAAARQGRLEDMYRVMYETQPQWGDQQVDHRETFLGFARALGLDMPAFVAVLDDPATADRVDSDFRDGIAAGVRGTPTLFIDGQQFQGAPTYESLRGAIEAALAR